ncbi:electron transfer flavoprotein subunit alpha [uncultured Megamonas sp.]|uniref:electron transfer flavoprotein subunit alpha n=1 Tax=uncultured Megamonas sp. TaxID=286140 RepID=UPI0025F72544|nr:electron transfer flavoprotein subunit alpha [uncultured Megamonas sp.]
MAKLVVHQDKINDINELISICPFGAMEENDGKLNITAGCRLCRLCVRKGPKGAVEYVEDEKKPLIDKSIWNGIAVYVEHVGENIHPVTYELIGKARELADKINQPVYAVFVGNNLSNIAEKLLHYNVDKVFVYDDEELAYFNIEKYTNVFEDFIKNNKPTSILVGATPVGRQLAPKVAARFKTGLTADCTILDMKSTTDLVQIRPAFGGNIMAEILTPNNRPQMATVRYKVMETPAYSEDINGEIVNCKTNNINFESNINILDVIKKPKEENIESADVLIVAGRGVKKKEDLSMLEDLADLLNGQLAVTRPLVENGWAEAKRQIGLSGKTVRPKLIMTCGVSGAIQFVAGMNNAETIFAINNDEKAPIFKYANYAIVGDIYEVIPKLIEKIKVGEKLL